MMDSSFSYNDTKVNFNEFPGSQPSPTAAAITEDPTNREQRNGFQYDYLTAGSGIGNVYVNSKWLLKVSGLYQLPYQVNVSAFYNARQGYPQEITVQVPTCAANQTSGCRNNGSGTIDVLLNPVGETRLPNYQNVDFHVERPFKARNVRFVPSLDVFNVTNGNTIQAIRSRQNTQTVNAGTGVITPGNANQIQAILAPRVIRFGVRVSW